MEHICFNKVVWMSKVVITNVWIVCVKIKVVKIKAFFSPTTSHKQKSFWMHPLGYTLGHLITLDKKIDIFIKMPKELLVKWDILG
jgi:hypothetical protein